MNKIYSKILYILGCTIIIACLILEIVVLVYRKDDAVPAAAVGDADFQISDTDKQLLARFVCIESDGEPFICKVAIAAVVLNRTVSEEYPSTVSEVIFSAAPDIDKTELDDGDMRSAKNAVNLALRGNDPSNGALRYYRHGDGDEHADNVIFRASDMVFTR